MRYVPSILNLMAVSHLIVVFLLLPRKKRIRQEKIVSVPTVERFSAELIGDDALVLFLELGRLQFPSSLNFRRSTNHERSGEGQREEMVKIMVH